MTNNTINEVQITALSVSRAFISALSVIGFLTLIVEFWGFLEFKLKKHDRHIFELRVYILLNCLFGTILLSLISWTLLDTPWEHPTELCDAIVRIYVGFYCVYHQVTFLFFLKKASLVSGFEKSLFYKNLEFCVRWSLMIFIPFIIIPAAGVLMMGYVGSHGVCLIFATQIWVPALFLVGAILLSISFLYLFIQPLRTDESRLTAGHKARKDMIKKVIKRNTILTGIAMSSTTIHIIMLLIVNRTVASDFSLDYLEMYFLISSSVDIAINSICLRCMTNIWIPEQLRKLFFSHKDQSEEPNSINRSSKKVGNYPETTESSSIAIKHS